MLDTSDLPGGRGQHRHRLRDALAQVLAEHDDVDGVWYFGTRGGRRAEVERLSAGNMKRTWVDLGRGRDWADPRQGAGEEFLRAGDPGEEHLGAVRGVRSIDNVSSGT